MQHYFSNNENLEHHYQTITYMDQGKELKFTTDNGVFSKNMIDYGSRVLLDAIPNDLDGHFLDVGCGYGTLGVVLAKRNKERTIDMVDVNERALELAALNAKQNCVDNQVDIFVSDSYQHVDKKYDAIVTNPPIRAGKKVVHAILTGAYQHLNSNGSLWVVIQKKQGAPSAKKQMEETFGNCEIVTKDKGYYILQSVK